VPVNRSRGPSRASPLSRDPSSCDPLPMHDVQDKPSWVDALEESLLLAIGLFTLITWIAMIGLLAH
jgi:hypothetical protein